MCIGRFLGAQFFNMLTYVVSDGRDWPTLTVFYFCDVFVARWDHWMVGSVSRVPQQYLQSQMGPHALTALRRMSSLVSTATHCAY